jgi:hypothetical protein
MIDIIRTFYYNTVTAVTVVNLVSDYFITKCGVKQGYKLSPILFTMYVNDLYESLDGGVRISGIRLKVLM